MLVVVLGIVLVVVLVVVSVAVLVVVSVAVRYARGMRLLCSLALNEGTLHEDLATMPLLMMMILKNKKTSTCGAHGGHSTLTLCLYIVC